jgi:2'-5' RNA ligase
MNDAAFIRYFFAVRPDRATASLIGRIRDSAGPFGSRVSNDRLHITLGILAEQPRPDEHAIAWARAVLADCPLRACAIALGGLVVGDGIAMLIPAGRHAALRTLQSGLFDRLARHGVQIRRPESFRPHMTLGYRTRLRERRRIAPIAWLPDRIVLIESWVGRGRHCTVASWPLLPAAQYDLDFDPAHPSLLLYARNGADCEGLTLPARAP